ncbi:MAG: ABC transporter substrate-binding protein [Syntrophorhabdaceae bacterium]|nr:ABC transporter substrate-binding protein [Syntrophorhabdaceae bacterium]
MKKRAYVNRIPLMICVLLMVFICPLNSYSKDKIKLGLITPLTGDVKTFGESSKNGFLLALEEYTPKGRYTIEPVIADDRNDPTEGANAALKLITQDRVIAISGPLTSKVAIPVSEIANKNRIPMITGSATNPKVTVHDGNRKPYIFRACFIDPFQGSIAATFALKELKLKTAAIVYDVGNDYSKGLAEFFKSTFSKGGTVVGYESYQKDDVDFSAIITKISSKKPDVIFLPDYYNKVALIARQIREKGLKSLMMGGDGWDSPELIKIAGDALSGCYFTNHYSPERKDPVTETFIKKYRGKHGVIPDALAALSYDATMILLRGLDSIKTPSQEELVRFLSAMKNYKGVTGNITFDKNGDAIKSVALLKIEGGRVRYVTTINP